MTEYRTRGRRLSRYGHNSPATIPSARGRVLASPGYSADNCGREFTLSPIANLFWNARERRPRAGWRLLVFLVMLLVVAALEGRVRAGLTGRLPDLMRA
jgi:hypothetical protein